MPRLARASTLTLSLALAVLALAGCGNSYQSQAALRMRDICSQRQSWCKDGLVVVERLPPAQLAVPIPIALLEIARFHCDDQSGGQGTSFRVTAHVLNYGTAVFDNAQPVNMIATLSDDGQRVLNKVVANMGPHTKIAYQSQVQPVDPTDISVPFDFGDISGTMVREVTVSFDPATWTGFALNGGTLSWPVWNNAGAVSQTALDLTASGTCRVQVPAGQ
jgi:hypothetical protein